MIDWYLILFVAITLIIFHMKEFGEHPDSARYIQDRATVPVSAGTMQLLFRLMTGTFLFIPFYFTITYGYLAGLALALAGAAVLLSFGSLVEELSGNSPFTEGRQSFVESRFSKKGLIAFYILAMAAGAEGLLISTLLASEFLKQTFGISPYMAAIPVLGFSFIFAGMGGTRGLRKVGTWLIMMFFTGITILPLSAFLINGAKPIYLALYAKNGANMDLWQLLIGVLLFMPVLAGQLLIYLLLSSDLLSIKSNKVKLSVRLGSISWSSIPLAVSLIVLYLLSITESSSASGLLAGLKENMPVLLVYVLVFVVLSGFVIGVGLSLYIMTSLMFTAFPGIVSTQKGYLFSLILSLIPLTIVNSSLLSLESILIFFMNLFASMALPLWLTVKAKVRWGIEFASVILLSAVFGSWSSMHYGWMIGIPFNLGVSSLAIIILLIRNIRKI